MPTPRPTIDEFIATLKKSSLPTVLVEGVDDIQIYRWIEERIGIGKADILPCGGRKMLLDLFDRRAEFPNLRAAFVADRDMYVFSAIPPQYSNIVWTAGYSIENDLYADSLLEKLLDVNEAEEHAKVLKCVIKWFAFEVEEFRRGNVAQIAIHPNQVVPLGTTTISAEFITRRGYVDPSPATIKEISKNYKLKVRGKTLFDLLVRYLSSPRRATKHSTRSLCEVAFKTKKKHRYIDRLTQNITNELHI